MRVTLNPLTLILIGLGLPILSLCAISPPIGRIEVQNFAGPIPQFQNTHPQPNDFVEIEGYVTGWVKAPADILIDQSAENLTAPLKNSQWVPSIAYAVRHPVMGVVVFDAGLKSGKCEYGLRPIYWVPCRNVIGSDLVSQLKNANIPSKEIKYIIPSHLHGDHISGLEALLSYANAPLLMTSQTLAELQSPLRFSKGIPSDMVKADMHIELIDTHWESDSLLGQSVDVFGDGTLKLISTNGHSGGHISAWVQTKHRPTLLTFDAAHIKANLDLAIPSGAVHSRDAAQSSLDLIQNIKSKLPQMRVIYGHEPKQWDCKTRSVNVLGATCVFTQTQ